VSSVLCRRACFVESVLGVLRSPIRCAFSTSTRVGVSGTESFLFSCGVLGFWWRSVSVLARLSVSAGAAFLLSRRFWVSAVDTLLLWSKYLQGGSGVITAAQQGAAPDRLQLRSSFLLSPLPAAGELVVVLRASAFRRPIVFGGDVFSGRRHFVACVKSCLSGSLVAATSLLLVRRFCRGWVRWSLRLRGSWCCVSVGFVGRRYFASRGGSTLSFDGFAGRCYFVARSGSTRVGASAVPACLLW
jgi:hypothetical protein